MPALKSMPVPEEVVDTGGIALGQMQVQLKNLPLVRILFDRFSSDEKVVTPSGLQSLCYEFGVYFTYEEIVKTVQYFDSRDVGTLSYDDFMVWWRTNEQFR